LADGTVSGKAIAGENSFFQQRELVEIGLFWVVSQAF
jgi:hypothetical protein